MKTANSDEKKQFDDTKIVVYVEPTSTGYSAHAVQVPAFTTGRCRHELITNMIESIELCFEQQGNRREVKEDDIMWNWIE